MVEPRAAEPAREESAKREQHRVPGDRVVEKIRELLREGNVRHVVIKNDEGRTLIEFPVTLGVAGALLLPVWAAVGAVAAVVGNCSIEVERVDAEGSADGVTEDHSFISNQDLAGILDRIAELLELREANPFRVGSYRGAALEIRALPDPVWRLREEGGRGSLQDIPGVGEGIAAVLDEVLDTGSSRLLERLEEEASPEVAFRAAAWRRAHPGGAHPRRAGRAHVGGSRASGARRRLARVRGVGTKTAAGIRDALAGILGGRRAAARPTSAPPGTPSHRSSCCSRWTRSTGRWRKRTPFRGSRPDDSTPGARVGFRSCTSSGTAGT